VLGGAGHGRGSRRDGIVGESACGDGGVGQIAAAMGCRSRRPGTWGWNLGIGIMGRRREGTCCRCRPRRWACGSPAFPASSLARRHPCFRPAGFRSSRAYPAASCRGPRAFWKPVSETFLRRRSRLDLRAARVLCVERGTRDEGSRCLRARCAVRSRKRSGGGRVSLRRARLAVMRAADCEDVRRRSLWPFRPRAWTWSANNARFLPTLFAHMVSYFVINTVNISTPHTVLHIFSFTVVYYG
jgi:hypothetical protein